MESCENDKREKGNISGGGSNINGSLSSSPTSNNTTNSRWNPTKEQISMLENLYSQGIRTPSAEQIQQITSRLSVYGHIEGKNVFYWFQNHKARQRQKQKQQNLAYINRFLHETTPPPIFTIPPYPCPNVVCSPYLIPLNSSQDIVLPPQYRSKVPFVIPSGIKRRQRDTHKLENLKTSFDEFVVHETNINGDQSSSTRRDVQETLALFPLHPTGILDQQTKQNSSCSSDQIDVGPTSTTMSNHQPAYYYDFLSSDVQGCCESSDHFNLS